MAKKVILCSVIVVFAMLVLLRIGKPWPDAEPEAQESGDTDAAFAHASMPASGSTSPAVREQSWVRRAEPETRAQLNKLADQDLKQRMRSHPSVEDEYLAEPVAGLAQEYEVETWEKVAALPGVESAVVQCRTSTCKVVMTGAITPATGFDIKGLTYYASGPDGLVFFYDKDLDVE